MGEGRRKTYEVVVMRIVVVGIVATRGGGGVNGTATAMEDALFLIYDDANNSGGNGTIYATPPLPAAAPPSPFAPSSSSKDDADDDHHENNDLHINCQKTITWRSSLNGDCFTPKTASVIVALMLFAMSTRTSADVFVKVSAFGPAFTTYLVAFVLLQSLVVENVVAPRHFFPSRGGKAAFRGVATLLGACSSAFFVHHAVVPVLKTNKKSKNNMRNLVFAYILACRNVHVRRNSRQFQFYVRCFGSKKSKNRVTRPVGELFERISDGTE
jgi:hypothetical protein